MDIVSKQNFNGYAQANLNVQQNTGPGKTADSQIQQIDLSDTVQFSDQSMIHNQIDDLYSQVDGIYMSHVSAADKKTLEKAYAELDKLYQSGQTTEAQDKRAEELFGQIDKIFSSAEAKLSPEDKKKVDALNEKIDVLFEQYDEDYFEELPDELLAELEPLEQELDQILTSKLSKEQKDKLDGLHAQIGKLFERTEHSEADEKAIEKAFDKIDNIMNKSFQALSDEDKQRVNQLESQIDGLFEVVSGQGGQPSGYYPV